MEVYIWCDGAAMPNGGPARTGYVVVGGVHLLGSEALGDATHNVAEFSHLAHADLTRPDQAAQVRRVAGGIVLELHTPPPASLAAGRGPPDDICAGRLDEPRGGCLRCAATANRGRRSCRSSHHPGRSSRGSPRPITSVSARTSLRRSPSLPVRPSQVSAARRAARRGAAGLLSAGGRGVSADRGGEPIKRLELEVLDPGCRGRSAGGADGRRQGQRVRGRRADAQRVADHGGLRSS